MNTAAAAAPATPEVGDGFLEPETGRILVEALAHRWGVEERAGGVGKTVWVELKAPDMVVPLRPQVNRTGRGSLQGQIHIPDDFAESPGDIADAFGMR